MPPSREATTIRPGIESHRSRHLVTWREQQQWTSNLGARRGHYRWPIVGKASDVAWAGVLRAVEALRAYVVGSSTRGRSGLASQS